MLQIWKLLGLALMLAVAAPAAAYHADRQQLASAATGLQLADAKGHAATVPKPLGKVDDLGVGAGDYTLGSPEAGVVLVEYASLTCPHCAVFHEKMMPMIKKDYIDTGKIYYVYRDFPLDRLALAAAVVARCGGRDRFFGFIETLYGSQDQWARASDPLAALRTLALVGGMSKTDFEACIREQKGVDAILEARLAAARKFGVNSTPTIFVNGNRYRAAESVDGMRALLDSFVAKR